MSSSSGVNGIVVDLLNRENYSSWKVLVMNYLMGKDLWYNIIEDEDEKYEDKAPPKEDKDGKGEEQPPPKEDKDDSKDDKEGDVKEQPPSKEYKADTKASLGSSLKKEDIEKARAKSVEEYRRKNPKEWEMKNRRALHAIQLSCGKTLGQIKNMDMAKEAWEHLKTSFSEDIKAYDAIRVKATQTGDIDQPTVYEQGRQFRERVKKGFLQEVKVAIDVSPDYVFSRSPEDGRTALHIAAVMGRVEIVDKLILVGKKRLLEMRDNDGYTALALAAKLTDNKDMAASMVENGGHHLLTLKSHKEKQDDDEVDDDDDKIPVLLASAKGHKNMTRYLFSKTSFDFFSNQNWKYGVLLLARCISNEIFDVAAEIIRHDDLHDPKDIQRIPLNHEKKYLRPIYALAHKPSAFPSALKHDPQDIQRIPLDHEKKYLRPIYALAHKPSAFPSALKHDLSWCERFICDTILTLSVKDLNKNMAIVFHEPEEIERPTIMTHTLPGRLFGRLRQFVQTSILLKFDVFKKMHQKKVDRYYVLEILDYLSKRVSIISEVDSTSANDAMLQAAKYGITEIIDSMRYANPELLLVKDKSDRGILAHAILNRQEGVFQLINRVANKDTIASVEDTLKYNLLHIAAELGPSSYLDRISNAALQMQRELQWFQDVKNVVPQWCHDAKDPNGKTASEVFTEEHKELLKSGQQWAKDTATSFTIIGTLIITIMFAAAFTVPGGNNDNNGTPVILSKNHNVFRKGMFNVFVTSVAVSLATSSSSVLVFIGILTSPSSENAFLKWLPLKVLFGCVTLFLSVTAMMCAFIAGLDVMLERYRRVVIAAIWFASLPILVFVFPMVFLVSEIILSTYCKLK